MADIHDIPFEEIELFLSKNDKSISKNTAYDDALELIKSCEAKYYSDIIVLWMIAYNLLQLNAKIPKLKKSEILALPSHELTKLARSLILKKNNIDNIIHILFYLHKLDDVVVKDANFGILSILNEDTIIALLRTMDISTVGNICKSSKQIKAICESTIGRQTIIDKLPKNDRLDVSSYTIEELIFFNEVSKMKKSIIGVTTNYAYFYFSKTIYVFSKGNRVHTIPIDIDDINQTIMSQDKVIILTNDGMIYHKDLRNNKYTEFHIADKIAGIFEFENGKISIITATGDYFIWDGHINSEPYQVVGLHNIIQKIDDLVLTSEGEVYLRKRKDDKLSIKPEFSRTLTQSNLEDIKKYNVMILMNSYGLVESITSQNWIYYKFKNLSNIVQITKYYALDDNGRIYFINPKDYSVTQYSYN